MDQQLLTRARAQGGVFTSRDVAQLGVTKNDLDRCIRTGEVIRLLTGGYALASTTPDPWGLVQHMRLLRVALLLDRTAAAAHLSALTAYGVDLLQPRLDVAHVSRPGAQATSRRPALTRHLMPPQAEIRIATGIRAVDPVSALIQYAKDATFEEAVAAVDSALHQDLVLPQLLQERLPTLPRNAGPAKISRIIAASDRWAESVGETRARLFLAGIGFQPFSQVPIATERGHVFAQVDFQIVGTRVVVEFDGHGKYDQPGSLVAEKQREDRIRAAGYGCARLEWHELTAPDPFLRRLNDAIRADRTASSRERVGPCRYPQRNVVSAPHACTAPHPQRH